METIKTSTHNSIVRKNGKYYCHEYNQHTGSQELAEIKFDPENDGGAIMKNGNTVNCWTKEKLDIMFELQKQL